jgi:hypothetical protein
MARRAGNGYQGCVGPQFRVRLKKIAKDLAVTSKDLGKYRRQKAKDEPKGPALDVIDLHIENLNDLEARAKRTLNHKFFGFMQGGGR